jgi:hypothetical protein
VSAVLERERASFAAYRRRAVESLREKEDLLTSLENEVTSLRTANSALRRKVEDADRAMADAQHRNSIALSRATLPLPATQDREVLEKRLVYVKNLVLSYMRQAQPLLDARAAPISSLLASITGSPGVAAADPSSSTAATLASALATVLSFSPDERALIGL